MTFFFLLTVIVVAGEPTIKGLIVTLTSYMYNEEIALGTEVALQVRLRSSLL